MWRRFEEMILLKSWLLFAVMCCFSAGFSVLIVYKEEIGDRDIDLYKN
jgi:hypothetical protein